MFKTKLLIAIHLLFAITMNSQFSKCTDIEGGEELKLSLCANVKVPLNYQTNTKDSISLFVRKFPATKKRKGSIWLIPGGPGESGASLYPLISQFSEIFPQLDIFVPDHRGTGYSSKICPKGESIDSPNGVGLVGKEWGACFNQMYSNQPRTTSFTITNGAKDLSYLINELSGEGEKYIYGVSYGTQLILRLLQLETTTLDGVILDSLVPLQNDKDYDLSKRSFVVNSVGESVLKFYDKQEGNKTGTLASKLKEVVKKIETNDTFKSKLPNGDITLILGMFLDVPTLRNKIPTIIESLAVENVTPYNNAIKELTDFYTSYGGKYKTSKNSIPLVQIISSSENNLRTHLKKEEVVEESKNLLFKSSLPGLLAGNSMPTYKKDRYFGKIPNKFPKMLVIHGTLDPKTHVIGADRHVEKLRKKGNVTYVKVKDAPHFISLFAPNAFSKEVTKFMRGKKQGKLVIDHKSLLK